MQAVWLAAKLVVELLILGASLWAFARRMGSRPLVLLTLGSFSVRWVVGELLYLISYFQLPLLQDLQFDRGFWRFGLDAWQYQRHAVGAMAVLTGHVAAPPYLPGIGWLIGALYLITGPNPQFALPILAFAAAAGVPLAWLIATKIGQSERGALLSAGLLAFWPSSMAWSGQLMQDAVRWLGLLLVFAGVATAIRSPLTQERQNKWGFAAVTLGAVLTAWLGGKYATLPLVFVLLCGLALQLALRRHNLRRRALDAVLLLACVIAGSFPAYGYVTGEINRLVIGLDRVAGARVEGKPAPGDSTTPATAGPAGGAPAAKGKPAPGDSTTPATAGPAGGAPAAPALPSSQFPEWNLLPVDPHDACAPIAPLLGARLGFTNTPGPSTIDASVTFRSCWDVLAYAPRALELSLITPLPFVWSPTGGSVGEAARFAVLDGLLLLVLMPGFIVAVPRALGGPRAGSAALVLHVVLMAFIFGFVSDNFGTLFRLRLQAVLPMAVLAVGGWEMIVAWTRSRLHGHRSLNLLPPAGRPVSEL